MFTRSPTLGVADVAEVVHLGARADAAGLDLGEIAQFGAVLDHRAGSQMAERTDLHALADDCAFEDRHPHAAGRADFRIREQRVRADLRVASDPRSPQQMAPGLDDDVGLDLDLGLDVGRCWIDDRDARAHERRSSVLRRRIAFASASCARSLTPSTSSSSCVSTASHAATFRGREIDQLRQVVLAFRAARQSLEHRPQPGCPHQQASRPRSRRSRAARAWRPAPRPCRDAAIGAAQDASIAARVRHARGQQGERCAVVDADRRAVAAGCRGESADCRRTGRAAARRPSGEFAPRPPGRRGPCRAAAPARSVSMPSGSTCRTWSARCPTTTDDVARAGAVTRSTTRSMSGLPASWCRTL